MKKTLLLLVSLLLSTWAFGQMEFHGIKLGQDYRTFEEALKTKGFSLFTDQLPNLNSYTGTFCGKNDAIVNVMRTNSGTVWKVVVWFDNNADWDLAKSAYYKYQKSLSEKYDFPDGEVAEFSKPYFDGDGYEINALYLNKASFKTYWLKDSGMLLLELVATERDNAFISISYEDNKSAKLKASEEQQLLNGDL